ncbi:hydroxymethylglutaryl-CoA reductase, degradative [Roseobacter sp. HKCCD9010]|uniref:hydroxymethylglutaryl-CoA reductase, degradative n=1 Tax=unclassified Roseobacter TaxID=196798 RepID=UPI001491002D|nr:MULTISPECIES: hydroxymethylglutaryl-CoA reductase, degradative [unclassified Roseobacter]MBF9052369.1 hydroxymethylglutaryl-CoA reductase, degradative [Rhodobacterales bacterium HKCCD4356]NNV14356.1 hydroxymethylglutaryl-CoA reductase, degradative [Roseobacter sp. HKCCD7357]NNV18535.1 hydroxymethylglutaryl-CoA reductase, degradative [Roseobacter sp. HKCCD8768]NNV27986.1 hydroxymethylglutaryl-CoA reductase, degradative [Roseobacter sp. HKCCD8192]NNV32286.1 hydroxymethylglutaryl-CoA reductase
MPNGSRIEGLRAMTPDERLHAVAGGLAADVRTALAGRGALPEATANGMIENVMGVFELPLAVAANFTVNGRDYLIPMAIEEPSVVAAASYMARIARGVGGFHASASEPVMRAQIQVLDVADTHAARARLLAARDELMADVDACDPVLVEVGGGCRDIEVHLHHHRSVGAMLVLHILVDVRDAMGANAVNSIAEALAPKIAEIAGGRVRLRILSNLADRRLVRAHVALMQSALATEELDGADVAQGMVEACALAELDPYRAATHNKGIMNGIDPVVLATGNDWRAIEAGAHAWAARDGHYTALTRWERTPDGVSGTLEMPMAVGLVGGATKTHPTARAALDLMGVKSATELGQVIAAVGLAQNMAALRALATEGIQKGHMALHARNIAISAGATGADVDHIAATLAQEGDVSVARARALLAGT